MSQRPNILIILVDQLRADVCGCYGGWPGATTYLDRFAAGGTVFTQAYCPYPQCSPTRASLMTGLEPVSTGIGIQTIVVYVSDHGDYCGAHGNLSKGVAPYEELLRVPLVFRWPGNFSAGATCEELVTHMDILPTLAEVAGVDIPDEIDGSALGPLLSGEPSEWRDHVVITHHGNAYGLCTMRAVITNDYKYVYWPYDTAELYDRQTDEWEMENRINDPGLRGVAERLHGMLLAHRQRTGDPFRPASAPPRET